jgi:hypothetical protein
MKNDSVGARGAPGKDAGSLRRCGFAVKLALPWLGHPEAVLHCREGQMSRPGLTREGTLT